MDAVVASSYGPCVLGPDNADLFRGRAWIDAAASTSMENVCDSLDARGTKCVQVVAVQVGKGSPNDTFDGCTKPQRTTANTGPLYPLLPVDEWTLPLNCSVYYGADDFKLVPSVITSETICPGWCDRGLAGGVSWGRGVDGLRPARTAPHRTTLAAAPPRPGGPALAATPVRPRHRPARAAP